MSLDLSIYLSVEERLTSIVRDIVSTIRAEVPQYSVLPVAEQNNDLLVHLTGVLEGMKRKLGPDEPTISHARDVGIRRADLRLELKDVVEAYHIAYREVWNELLRSIESTRGIDIEMAQEVTLLWTWFHRITAAVTEGYTEQTNRSAATKKSLVAGLFSVLLTPESDADSAARFATELGFDPHGQFTAVSVHTLGAEVAGILDQLKTPGVKAVSNTRDLTEFAVLLQTETVQRYLEVIVDLDPSARSGVGLERPGLQGARLSLRDSADALALGRVVDRDVDFSEDWLYCLAQANRTQLELLLQDSKAIIEASPHLAEAVRAYLSAGFSIAECGRRLNIHSNSAKYRIERWQVLTGWDLGSVQGVVGSALAVYAGPTLESRQPDRQ